MSRIMRPNSLCSHDTHGYRLKMLFFNSFLRFDLRVTGEICFNVCNDEGF